MPRKPAPPITRVYLLADEREILLVCVAGEAATDDALQGQPLLRDFLQRSLDAGWSATCIAGPPTPSLEEGKTRRTTATGTKPNIRSWQRRVLH